MGSAAHCILLLAYRFNWKGFNFQYFLSVFIFWFLIWFLICLLEFIYSCENHIGLSITWIIYPTLKSRWGKYIFKLSLVKYQFKGILGKMSTKYLDVIIWSESVWRCLGWCTRRVINYRKKWATHTLATQLGEVAGWGCELEK